MRVAVSGASGFVGSHLCKRLEDQGAEVFHLSRRASENSGKVIAWEPSRGLVQPEILNDFDGIFHLAGGLSQDDGAKKSKLK